MKSFISKVWEIFQTQINQNKIYKIDEYDPANNIVIWNDWDYTYTAVPYCDLYDYVVDSKTGLPKSKWSSHEMFIDENWKYRLFYDIEIPNNLKDTCSFINIQKIK